MMGLSNGLPLPVKKGYDVRVGRGAALELASVDLTLNMGESIEALGRPSALRVSISQRLKGFVLFVVAARSVDRMEDELEIRASTLSFIISAQNIVLSECVDDANILLNLKQCWQKKLFALMVQKKSFDISSKRDDATSREKLQKVEERFMEMKSSVTDQLEILAKKESEAEFQRSKTEVHTPELVCLVNTNSSDRRTPITQQSAAKREVCRYPAEEKRVVNRNQETTALWERLNQLKERAETLLDSFSQRINAVSTQQQRVASSLHDIMSQQREQTHQQNVWNEFMREQHSHRHTQVLCDIDRLGRSCEVIQTKLTDIQNETNRARERRENNLEERKQRREDSLYKHENKMIELQEIAEELKKQIEREEKEQNESQQRCTHLKEQIFLTGRDIQSYDEQTNKIRSDMVQEIETSDREFEQVRKLSEEEIKHKTVEVERHLNDIQKTRRETERELRQSQRTLSHLTQTRQAQLKERTHHLNQKIKQKEDLLRKITAENGKLDETRRQLERAEMAKNSIVKTWNASSARGQEKRETLPETLAQTRHDRGGLESAQTVEPGQTWSERMRALMEDDDYFDFIDK
ncbi:hypothetical protein PROFUN_09229 [Planoprotostelium fungivorum]|uniref:Uncharacterized protein n=1 Tax=Planoprotostelium fungivorum TaxID=1890364 RepID=A0A2P6NHL2_9EUKA|nr:hypothetical protein PROFUN_09229 [Planoprotostelium fungivorum]